VLLKWAVFHPKKWQAYKDWRKATPQQQAEADKRLLEKAADGDVDAAWLCYQIFEDWQPPDED
jgi:hypothetical protein